MRVAYAGSPAAAVVPLRALHASGHTVVGVVTQPDRPRGRRGTPTPTAVAEAALELDLPLMRPPTINAPEVIAELERLGAEALVVVAFGQLLRQAVLDRWPCINVHFSLLPAYRGAAPVERAIMDGVSETGVTIMQMDAGLDTGPELAVGRAPVGAHDTAGDLLERLSHLGADLLVQTLTRVELEGLSTRAQSAEGISLAAKIGPADRPLDPRRPAIELDRQIRALAPHIGATLTIDGQSFKIWEARATQVAAERPLAVVEGHLMLRCGDGRALEITRLQPPGRGRMAVTDFIRGWRGEFSLDVVDG